MKKKTGSSKLVLLVLLLFCAFVLWYFWPEITSWIGWQEKKPAPAKQQRAPKENISKEDRKKLEEILKQKGQ